MQIGSDAGNIMEKAVKTSALFVGVIGTTMMMSSSQNGNANAALVGSFLLFAAHQLGKERRPGANVVAKVTQKLQNEEAALGTAAYNMFRNTVNGGAAITDGVVKTFGSCAKKVSLK